MTDFFDLVAPLFKNLYVLFGFIAFILLVVGLALPDETKNADGSVNDNKSTKNGLIATGSVIAAIDLGLYFYNSRKSSKVVPMYYY